MRYLQYAGLASAVTILLHIVERGLVSFYREEKNAIENIMGDAKLLVFLYVVFFILAGLIVEKLSERRLKMARYTVVFFGLLAVIETGVYFLLKTPQAIPAGMLPYARLYYERYACDRVQFNPRSAGYDQLTTYRLKPNASFSFCNFEYSNKFTTNEIGLRDNNQSLANPEIICLGDSYTMGWGIDQERAFPDVLGSNLGVNVLNAGIASFATAREMSLLSTLNRQNLKYIVIQYCENDATENNTYVSANYHLKIMTPGGYEALCQSLQSSITYFPFKHTLTILRLLLLGKGEGSNGATDQPAISYHEQALNFFSILANSADIIGSAKVFVLDASGDMQFHSSFTSELKKILATNPTSFRVEVVDLAERMTKADFFTLDTHINALGHKKIADIISSLIGATVKMKQ
jgi:hypothetical protein